MKKFSILLATIMVAAAMLLSACGGGDASETQVAADLCLRGNEAACRYHAALVEFERAEQELALSKEAYEASLLPPKESVTPTPEEKGGDN